MAGSSKRQQRRRAQAEERRSGIKEPHPPAVGPSPLFPHPSKPQLPRKQPSILLASHVSTSCERRLARRAMVLSRPGPSPDPGCKSADETKGRRSALQERTGLPAVLQKCITGKIFIIKLRYQKLENATMESVRTILA